MAAGLGFEFPGWVSTDDAAASVQVQMLRVTTPAGGGGLCLAGEIDFLSVGLLESALKITVAAAPDGGDIRLDMGEVGFVDVAGTRALVRAATRLEGGRRLVLYHPPRVLLLVLDFFPESGTQIEVVPRRA